jgi:hypothetical protein
MSDARDPVSYRSSGNAWGVKSSLFAKADDRRMIQDDDCEYYHSTIGENTKKPGTSGKKVTIHLVIN